MARIDRLEEASKKTLQLASVIGREFTRRLLERIAEMPGADRGVPPRAQGHRADLREAPVPRAGLHVQARPDARRGVQLAARPAAQGAAPRSGSPSRSSTPTGSPSTTRCSPTTSARGGMGEGAPLSPRGGHQGRGRSAHPEAAAHLEQALGVVEHLPESRERTEGRSTSASPSGTRCSDRRVRADLRGAPEAETLAEDLDDGGGSGGSPRSWPTTPGRRSTTGGRSTSAARLAIAIDRGDVPLQIVAANVTAQTYHDQADYGPAIDLCERNVALIGDLARSVSASRRFRQCRPGAPWCFASPGKETSAGAAGTPRTRSRSPKRRSIPEPRRGVRERRPCVSPPGRSRHGASRSSSGGLPSSDHFTSRRRRRCRSWRGGTRWPAAWTRRCHSSSSRSTWRPP